MNSNYLVKPKLYNAGYLLNDSYSRAKQGLMAQTLASDCFVGQSLGQQYGYLPKNYVSCYSTNNTAVFTATINDAATGNVQISLSAANTTSIKAGRYVYDVKISS